MKILMLHGSPHKGNTWAAMNIVRDEIKKANTEVEFEEVNFTEWKLPYCTGCSLCFRKGESFCPHYSVMKELYLKLQECDGVILGTANYNMAPNALTKNVLDHICYMLHRPRYFDKKALVISTTGGVFAEKTVNYLSGTLMGIGFNRCYQLPINAYSWNNYQPGERDRKKIRKATLAFYRDVASRKLHAPSLGVLIPYNLFRGMSLHYVKGSEFETEDGNFWTQPQRAKSTYDPSIRVPLYKKAFGCMFYKIGKFSGRFAQVTYKK